MIILIKLILAHIIGDFLLQPKSWVAEKERKKAKSPKLYLHLLVHGVLILFLLWDFRYWWIALIIIAVHGIIDLLKLYFQSKKSKTQWFIADQFLHLCSIIVLWFIFFKPDLNLVGVIQNPQLWLYATALLFLTAVSAIFMQVLLTNWSIELKDGESESLANAGKYIGILERLFVFVFVVTGQWQAVGFLLAAKSVFRFGDLKESKDRKLTEYILIGTLLSFGMAVLTGLVVLKLSTIV
jgi:hypothetical protein